MVAVGISGSLFEHLLIDPVWPENLSLIQPERGGIDRKVFWIPVHSAITLAFLVAIMAFWPHREVRRWVLLAGAAYLVMRGWTALYFVPEALAFEKLPRLTPEDLARAKKWVRLSALRSLLLLLSFIFLCLAYRARFSATRANGG